MTLSRQRIEDFHVLRAMRKYGGGFVSALAEAGRNADDDNMRRLKAAWPEYWEKYTELAEIDLAKEKEKEL